MSPQLQEELAPGDLERKWTKLSKVSGGFRKVKDAVIAHQGGDTHGRSVNWARC